MHMPQSPSACKLACARRRPCRRARGPRWLPAAVAAQPRAPEGSRETNQRDGAGAAVHFMAQTRVAALISQGPRPARPLCLEPAPWCVRRAGSPGPSGPPPAPAGDAQPAQRLQRGRHAPPTAAHGSNWRGQQHSRPCGPITRSRPRPELPAPLPALQAPKEQKSKEAKALAAANSSKGKKKVRRRRRRRRRLRTLPLAAHPRLPVAAGDTLPWCPALPPLLCLPHKASVLTAAAAARRACAAEMV